MTDSEATPMRFIEDAVHLVSSSFKEVVPPAAQLHFLNAQRELLLAVAAIIEHNSQRSVRTAKRPSGRTTKPAASRRPAKVALD